VNKTLSIKGFSLLSRLKIYSNCLSRLSTRSSQLAIWSGFFAGAVVDVFFQGYFFKRLPHHTSELKNNYITEKV